MFLTFPLYHILLTHGSHIFKEFREQARWCKNHTRRKKGNSIYGFEADTCYNKQWLSFLTRGMQCHRRKGGGVR